eukprot:NODE_6904_length_1627_cov_3.096000.p1 GENE.NODE_6904_length_1627_cov_3.096000~~NODE_6904_length_1627_cov_3.096000.p1  ORF type:complete len:416 (-),score=92.12 NODE_6904_length_1627_cov_3.096000:378-1490(-)
MRGEGWEWSMRASFFEVYNEQLRDLLTTPAIGATSPRTTAAAPPQYNIKHDDVWGTVVTSMTTVSVDSLEQIRELQSRASKQRAVGATQINDASSRSHAVFALYLKGTNEKLGCELCGALHLVDLAGSERLRCSGATGERLKETQSINKSLSSLADVFLAKSERRSHVPFRNSRLTHLLEPCLSGLGKTLMLVNVFPSTRYAHESLCSLRFASQVAQCNTGGKAKRSVKPLVFSDAADRAAGGGSLPGALSSRSAGVARQPTLSIMQPSSSRRASNPLPAATSACGELPADDAAGRQHPERTMRRSAPTVGARAMERRQQQLLITQPARIRRLSNPPPSTMSARGELAADDAAGSNSSSNNSNSNSRSRG